jgi:hypothetical protein
VVTGISPRSVVLPLTSLFGTVHTVMW